jgi:putative ABC transport system permease protein
VIALKDLALAGASLRRSPGYAATIVLTLGFTLGALVTMFDLTYQILAAPLPYPNAQRLYISEGTLYKAGHAQFGDEAPYPALIEAYKRYNSDFERVALVSFGYDVIVDRTDSPGVNTGYATPEYFQLLGAPLRLGRGFDPGDGLDAHSPVAVISFDAWQELFNADPAVLGKTLQFGAVQFRIVGVTAEDFVEPQFAGVGRTTQVWLPWDYNLASDRTRNTWTRTDPNQHLVGLLKTSVPLSRAAQSLTSILNARFKEETAGQQFFDEMTIDFKPVPFREAILGESGKVALLLFAGALALLLIAAANITNLTLARAASQQKNMAIQAALGAQKRHLLQSIFAETVLLVGTAALLSLAVAWGGIQLLKMLAQTYLPRLAELQLSWPSLAFAVLAAFVLASMFAVLVSRQIDYRALNESLKGSGKGSGIQVSGRLRQILILSQVALTGILLAASLQILDRSVRHIAQPLGFTTRDVYYLSLKMGAQRNASATAQRDELVAIRRELSNNPKVVAASLASGTPIHLGGAGQYESALAPDPEFKAQQQAATTLVDANYLPVIGLRLVRGQNFQPNDAQLEAHSIIVNERFAHGWDPNGDVIGRLLYWRNSPDKGQTPYRVLGIVRDLTLPGRAEPPRIFIPQIRPVDPIFVLQVKAGQQIDKPELNALVARVNGQYRVSTLLGLERAHTMLVSRDSLSAAVTAVLVVLAVSLAAIGIYGVLSYTVLVRRLELGIRMALGARPATIFAQILSENLLPVVVGQALALAVLVGLWRWLQSSRYSVETSASSWLLPIVLIVVLTAATTLSSVWSVIRNPAADALRNE